MMTPEEKKVMYEIKDRLDDVLTALKGDDLGHSRGIIPIVKDHEDRIKKLESLKDRTMWTVFGLSIPSGYGLWEFFNKVFKGL
jgi:hypothetical protein